MGENVGHFPKENLECLLDGISIIFNDWMPYGHLMKNVRILSF